jgi:hypothetical protein
VGWLVALSNAEVCFFVEERSMAEQERSVVVARVAPEVELVSGSGCFFSGWGEEHSARFWRIWLMARPCGRAEDVRERLQLALPSGSRVLMAVFCDGGGDESCPWRKGEGGRDCGAKQCGRAQALVDFGAAEGVMEHGVETECELLEDAAVMPCVWEAKKCWAKGMCSSGVCAGEVAWEAQERMLGEAVDVAGAALLEREYDCIKLAILP